MTRADARHDVMLRHLGAAYYESLHGRAARSDLARVLDAVEAYLDERPLALASPPRRVGDVMTTSVVSVIPNTPAGEIAGLLVRYRTLPVLERGWKVAGVVSGADLRAAGTRARDLVGGARVIKIHGEYIPVRAEIVEMDAFSAHADADDLLAWLSGAPPLVVT